MKNEFILFLFLVTLFFSCDSDRERKELIRGEWMISDAMRRGRGTNTLNGLTFMFVEDSVFTNLPDIGDNSFEMESDSITIGVHSPLHFHIDLLDTSQMVLSGMIRNTPFVLKFDKVVP